VKPLFLKDFTATSSIGRGREELFASLLDQRSGLKACNFESVDLDTQIGEVAGVDAAQLPAELERFDCRNNRLAELALRQDDFIRAVGETASRRGRSRVGVFIGTSTSGILETELAYRARDAASGALPANFDYSATHNSFSVTEYLRRRLQLEGPAVTVSRGSRRCGLIVLDHALRLSLPAAVLERAVPSFRHRARRHLHR
jgi:3-oxoacyl-[acyl-carrier-protein] synthase I